MGVGSGVLILGGGGGGGGGGEVCGVVGGGGGGGGVIAGERCRLLVRGTKCGMLLTYLYTHDRTAAHQVPQSLRHQLGTLFYWVYRSSELYIFRIRHRTMLNYPSQTSI